MPFYLCNVASTFERLIKLVLKGLQWESCLVYTDDSIIFTNSFEEKMDKLASVFQRLRKAGLKLKPKKCCLFQKEVIFLGHQRKVFQPKVFQLIKKIGLLH